MSSSIQEIGGEEKEEMIEWKGRDDEGRGVGGGRRKKVC
jgi:hypothetical protein